MKLRDYIQQVCVYLGGTFIKQQQNFHSLIFLSVLNRNGKLDSLGVEQRGVDSLKFFLHKGQFYIKIFLFCLEVLSAKEKTSLLLLQSYFLLLPFPVLSRTFEFKFSSDSFSAIVYLISATSQCFENWLKRAKIEKSFK